MALIAGDICVSEEKPQEVIAVRILVSRLVFHSTDGCEISSGCWSNRHH